MRIDLERRRVARGRRALAARRVRGRRSACGCRRASPAEPGRVVATVGARLSDALATCYRVLLPAQARAALAAVEQLLRRRFRLRRGTVGRVRDGRVPPRPSPSRRGRRIPRRGVLPLQRGNRLVLSLSRGGLAGSLLSRRRVCTRRRRLARRPSLPREPARPPALLLEAPRARAGGEGEATSPRRCPDARRPLQGGTRPDIPRGGTLARLGRRRDAARKMTSVRLRLAFTGETMFPPCFPLLLENVGILWHVAGTVQGDGLFHLARVRKLLAFDDLTLHRVIEFKDGGLHPGYAFPLWHGFLAVVARLSGEDPTQVFLHASSFLAPLAVLVAYEAGWALFRRVWAAGAVAGAQAGLVCFAPGHGGAYALLAQPEPGARHLLVPAALALAFEALRAPSVPRYLSFAAAGLS